MKWFTYGVASIVIWGAMAAVILRILKHCGFSLPENRFFRELCADKRLVLEEQSSAKEVLTVFCAAFAFRMLLYGFALLAMYVIYGQERVGFADYLNKWVLWDANNYIRIAQGGYTYHVENGMYTTLVFLPLYSWLMRIINVFTGDLRLAGLAVSTLCYCGGCCYLYKLLCLDYGKETAKKACLYLSVFPFAFFFGAIMNESLLFLTVAACLYYIRQHNWMLVGITGIFAALSRIVGIFVVFAALAEFLEYYNIGKKLRNKQWKNVLQLFLCKGSLVCIAVLGILIYLYLNYKVGGSPFKFLEYQKNIWSMENCYLGKGLEVMFSRAFSHTENGTMKAVMWLPEALSYFFAMVLIVYGIRRNRSMYSLYFLVYFIVNASLSWPISGARYMSCAVPMFIVLADFSARHKWAHTVILVVFTLFMGIYFTGYLKNMQIF